MSADEEPAWPAGELDLWLFEEPGDAGENERASERERESDRAHRLKRLKLTVAELEGHAVKAAGEGDDARAEDLRRLAEELRAKHAKWDRRSGQAPKWRYLFRRHLFDRRRSS